jgi:hypothetical protein
MKLRWLVVALFSISLVGWTQTSQAAGLLHHKAKKAAKVTKTVATKTANGSEKVATTTASTTASAGHDVAQSAATSTAVHGTKAAGHGAVAAIKGIFKHL